MVKGMPDQVSFYDEAKQFTAHGSRTSPSSAYIEHSERTPYVAMG